MPARPQRPSLGTAEREKEVEEGREGGVSGGREEG